MSNQQVGLEFDLLAPGIHVYKNVIKDIDVFLKNIKNSFDNSELIRWNENSGVLIDGVETIDKTLKDVNVFEVPYKLSKTLLENHTSPKQAFFNIVGNKLYTALDVIEKDYMSHYQVVANEHDIYYIMKYEEDNFFTTHVDDSPEYPRTVSSVFYLNSDYEGGEIEFPRFGIKYKPAGNDVIMFPSNYIYDHKVHKVTSGDRYAVVTWLMHNKYPYAHKYQQ